MVNYKIPTGNSHDKLIKYLQSSITKKENTYVAKYAIVKSKKKKRNQPTLPWSKKSYVANLRV